MTVTFRNKQNLDVPNCLFTLATSRTNNNHLKTQIDKSPLLLQLSCQGIPLHGRSAVIGNDQRSSEMIGDHQKRSVIIGNNRRSSETIGDHRKRSAIIGNDWRSSETIGDHRKQSVIIGNNRRSSETIGDHRKRSAIIENDRRPSPRILKQRPYAADTARTDSHRTATGLPTGTPPSAAPACTRRTRSWSVPSTPTRGRATSTSSR